MCSTRVCCAVPRAACRPGPGAQGQRRQGAQPAAPGRAGGGVQRRVHPLRPRVEAGAAAKARAARPKPGGGWTWLLLSSAGCAPCIRRTSPFAGLNHAALRRWWCCTRPRAAPPRRSSCPPTPSPRRARRAWPACRCSCPRTWRPRRSPTLRTRRWGRGLRVGRVALEGCGAGEGQRSEEGCGLEGGGVRRARCGRGAIQERQLACACCVAGPDVQGTVKLLLLM
jgi:hypothetical protein